MELSKHFKLSEFIATNTLIENSCPEELIDNLKFIASRLEDIRSAHDKPIFINSGYRSDAVNKAVGGSLTSLHLKALAVDISISNYSVKELPRLFEAICDTEPYELYPISRDALHISWLRN